MAGITKRIVSIMLAFVMVLGGLSSTITAYASSDSEPSTLERLETLLDDIDALEATDWTAETYNPLKTMRDQVGNMGDLSSFAEATLANILTQLQAKYDALEESTLKKLNNLLLKIDELNATDWTAETYNPLKTMRDQVGNMGDLSSFAEAILANILTQLQTKYDALEPIEVKTALDLLNDLLAKIDALNPEDWTEESYTELKTMRDQVAAMGDLSVFPDSSITYLTSALQEKYDALVPAGEGDNVPAFSIEDGYYILPFSTWSNAEKTNPGYLSSTDYITFDSLYFNNQALLKVENGKYEITMRLHGADNAMLIGILNEEYFSGSKLYETGKTWATVSGTEIWHPDFDVQNSSLSENLKIGAVEENNKYWKPYTSEFNTTNNTWDVTFHVEDITSDFMLLAGKASVALQSTQLEFLDFSETVAQKIDLEALKTQDFAYYVLNGRTSRLAAIKYLAEVSEWSMSENTATAKFSFSQEILDSYGIEISFFESENYTAVQDGCFEISFDLSNYKDVALGKAFMLRQTSLSGGESDFCSYTVYPQAMEVKDVILMDNATGSLIVTNNTIIQENSVLVAEEIVDDTASVIDPYTVIHSNLGSSYKNIYMYKWSLLMNNETTSTNTSKNVQMKFKIPSDWNAENVQLFGYYENLGFDPVVDGEVEVDEDGNKYYVISTKVLGWYALYEIKDTTLTGEDLADGIYNVPISVYHFSTEGQLSMADRCLGDYATIVVENGEKTIYFNFTSVEYLDNESYMSRMWLYETNDLSDTGKPIGNIKNVIFDSYYTNLEGSYFTDVFNEGTLNYYPKTGFVQLVSDSAKWPVRFKVPIMDAIGGGSFEQDAWLIIDWANAERVYDGNTEIPISSALAELIKISGEADEEKFTVDSWSAFSIAFDAANIMINNTSAKSSQLIESYILLRDALDNLTLADESEEKNDDDIVVGDPSLNKDSLEDGKYTLTATMLKLDQESYSMANSAINHTVWLEVINGEYYLTIQFKGLAIYNKFGYLQNLYYYNDGFASYDAGKLSGERTVAEVLTWQRNSDDSYVIDQYNDSDSLYPELVRIKLVDKASGEFVPLQVFVPIMEAIADGTGTQNVLMKLNWGTLSLNEDGEIDKEEPVEQSPAVDYTDADTNVKVNADKGVFEADTVIDVTEITSGEDYNKAAEFLSDVGKKFKLYNVAFADGEGNAVAPNGTITLSFPIASGYDADNLFVYRINADGTKTRVNGTVADGYFTVVTRNAGTYALVEAGSTEADNSNNGITDTNSPQTGDTSNLGLWFALMIASLGAMLVTLKLGFKRKSAIGE